MDYGNRKPIVKATRDCKGKFTQLLCAVVLGELGESKKRRQRYETDRRYRWDVAGNVWVEYANREGVKAEESIIQEWEDTSLVMD